MTQPTLFDPYPEGPGWRTRDTSRAAAAAIAPVVKSLRARVFDALKARPDTPEGVAERLGEAVHSIRPRVSELAARNLVYDTGRRGVAMGGRNAIVWAVTPETTRAAA